jgi:hypothetical protein
VRSGNKSPIESIDVDGGCRVIGLNSVRCIISIFNIFRNFIDPGILMVGLESAYKDKEAGSIVLHDEKGEEYFDDILKCHIIFK